MKKYTEYKDSSIEWLGMIPIHWRIDKFSRVCYMKGRIGWQGLMQSEFSDDPYLPYLITGMNFKNGIINWDKVYHISEERYEEAPEIQLQVNDVLMTKDGTIGKLLYVDYLPNKASLNSHLLVLRPINGAFIPRFLYYQLQSQHFIFHVGNVKTGTTFFGITQEETGQYKVILPPNDEQTAIANFLDHKTQLIDDLTAKKKRLIVLLKEERTALINQAVTKGLNSNVTMKDSGIEWLGEIPEHWELKRLKFIVNDRLKYGANESAEDEIQEHPRYIRITDFDGEGNLRDDTFKSLPPEIAHDYLLQEGDVLFARSGATVGKTFIFKNYDGNACFAGYLIKAAPNPSIIDPDFLYYVTLSNYYQNWKNNIFIQATIQNIGADKYQNLLIPTPPIDEQKLLIKKIIDDTKRISLMLERLKYEIELFNEYKTSLINEAVTGKIDVQGKNKIKND